MIQAIQQVRLLEILPPSIRQDEKLSAVAKSLEGQLQKLSEQARLVLHLPRLDELSNEMLDALSDQFHIDYYEPENMSAEVKRSLIRTAILEHRIRGTKASVELMLNKILTFANVSEWYEYGGEPYYFRVTMQGLKFTDNNAEKFLRIINNTKNVRSWLELIIFDLTLEAPDTTLHVAQPFVDSSDNFIDLDMLSPPPQILTQRGFLIDEGCDTFNLSGDIDTGETILHVAIIDLETINEEIDCDRGELGDTDTAIFFERYIWQKWLEFKKNPVIEHYGHHGHGEIDAPDEPEYYPINTDFLRLYYAFPDTDSVRYITLYNPQEDLTGADIRYASTVTRGQLLHSRLKIPTTGIIRALYIRKKVEKVL